MTGVHRYSTLKVKSKCDVRPIEEIRYSVMFIDKQYQRITDVTISPPNNVGMG